MHGIEHSLQGLHRKVEVTPHLIRGLSQMISVPSLMRVDELDVM